jgi:hypothetical protein
MVPGSNVLGSLSTGARSAFYARAQYVRACTTPFGRNPIRATLGDALMNLPFCAQLYPQQSKPQASVHRLLSQSKIIALDAFGSP